MNSLDDKINSSFEGKVVRKDLTKLVKGNAIVPTYVLEYLLGQYCASDNEEVINEGVETVRNIISRHFVHRDESQLIKSTVREKGSHKIIDKIAVELNDKKDQYEAYFANLDLKRIPIDEKFIKQHPKLLSTGVWCIIDLGYFHSDEKDMTPWIIETLKPIQISNIDMDEFKEVRATYSKDEWIDLLMQTIGLNPEEFTFRSKLIQLTRLVPFVENNYNLIELGPKGTGKSHIYSELSPHGILISGGEVSKAKLFVNNSNGNIGLVGYWDVVAYDEFAGVDKRADRGLVDIMKNYMANKSFSRGTQIYGAAASMAFVGNTRHTVDYMQKHSDLFDALPKEYYDTAFLDRIHAYIPGWEVEKLRNEMFTDRFGFIVDYLAEVLKELRKEDRTHEFTKYFSLSDTITTRDKTSISKTYAGLAKVIYPHGELNEDQTREILEFAIECRKRVKLQLEKMDATFREEKVEFSFINNRTGEKQIVQTLENLGELPQEEKPTVLKVESEFVESVDQNKIELVSKNKLIFDNQTGITYNNLFGDYLKGATEIKLTDPFIRQPYQMRNFMEFVNLIAENKSKGEEVKLHLITNNEEEFKHVANNAFSEMAYSFEPLGINFTYGFDENIHDRSIVLNNGWKIILGRGLDIWQKTGGWHSIDEYRQERRRCKQCEITIIEDK